MNDAINQHKCLLDPCHSKVINVNKLDLSRMKLKMKIESRALKKITEEVLHEGNNYVVVVPENVYINPLETVAISSYDGIPGCYGSATEDQLKEFFGKNDPPETPVSEKDFVADIENKCLTLDEPANEAPNEPTIVTSDATSTDESFNFNPVSCPVDDIELQNAIWHITPDFNLENRAAPSEQVSYNDFLMEQSGEDGAGVLFDLS